MEPLKAADIAHPESRKGTKQHRKGPATGVDPGAEPIQVRREISLEQLMDEINRLRRDQLAVFVCSWNTVGPKMVQCEKFIVLKCIEKRRSAKLMIDRQTDIVTQELSELGLVCPIFMPVRHESPRVFECLGDRNGRYDGSNHHRHDRRCCCSLAGRRREQACAPEASDATCAIARERPAVDICCQCFQSTPVACDCARPEQGEESVLDVNWYWQPPIAFHMQIGGGICKKCKSTHRSGCDENSRSATEPPNAERPTRRARPVEILCVLGHEEYGCGLETSGPLQ